MAEAALANQNAAARPANASLSDWIAVSAGSLGALLATLDISITNSALPQIQGQIGATGTEGTWISTGYLMAEIVMIPLTAWLTRVFGLRRFLMSMAVLFTLFSIYCGLSSSLGEMIAGRIGQGLAGGAMIPTAQTIVRTRLPAHQLPIGMSVFGLTVLLGPLLGPVVGGWLTENASWRWCFFLNLPVSVALVTLLWVGLRPEKPDLERFFKADWIGIVGISVGLSCLTVVLEEGQRERWFESAMIQGLSLLTLLGFVLVVISQLTAKQPIVRLKLMANPRYASVIFIVSVVGAGLYGVSYLLPQFLGNVSGYNAQQAGSIMLLSGLPAFLIMPFLPKLLARYSAQALVITGLALFSLSCVLDIALTADSVGHDFYASQFIRGFAQMLAMMPLNQAAMSVVSAKEAGDAAGLYNMARNLGGSIGLALLGVLIDRREHLHDAALRESVSANSTLVQEQMAERAAAFAASTGDTAHAQMQALQQLADSIGREALVMTYGDCFLVLAVALAACIPLAMLLKKPDQSTK